MRQWFLDWRFRILAKKTSRLKRKYVNAIARQDAAEEKAINFWFIQQLKTGNNSLLDNATKSVLPATDPIDSMIEVVQEATIPARQPKTAATTSVLVATKQQDTATKSRTAATSNKDNKPSPAKTQGNKATAQDNMSATTFVRQLLDNNPEATTEQATKQWQQLGNNETTLKSLRATFTREKKKRATND